MNLAQTLAIIAKSKGLTLTELERMCNFPKSSIRKWSENMPNITKVISVCEILNIPIDTLVTGKNPIDYSLPIDEQQLLTDYRTADSVSKAVIRERAKALAEQAKSNKNNG